MKKKLFGIAIVSIAFVSCGYTGAGGNDPNALGNILGSVIGAATNTGTLTNILYNVIGGTKLTQQEIIGTWKYDSPGCAFTSEKLLAKAGGEIIATEVKERLAPTYRSLGFSSSNTFFTFKEDGTFSGKVDGKSISGTYAYNEKSGSIQLRTLLLNMNAYLARSAGGMSLTFESKKLISALQVLGSLSGNSEIAAVSEIAGNYDGIRLGFDMNR